MSSSWRSWHLTRIRLLLSLITISCPNEQPQAARWPDERHQDSEKLNSLDNDAVTITPVLSITINDHNGHLTSLPPLPPNRATPHYLRPPPTHNKTHLLSHLPPPKPHLCTTMPINIHIPRYPICPPRGSRPRRHPFHHLRLLQRLRNRAQSQILHCRPTTALSNNPRLLSSPNKSLHRPDNIIQLQPRQYSHIQLYHSCSRISAL